MVLDELLLPTQNNRRNAGQRSLLRAVYLQMLPLEKTILYVSKNYMSNLDMKFWDVVGTCFMSTHNFSYNFLTRIKLIFMVVAFVACKHMVALDTLSCKRHVTVCLAASHPPPSLHPTDEIVQKSELEIQIF